MRRNPAHNLKLGITAAIALRHTAVIHRRRLEILRDGVIVRVERAVLHLHPEFLALAAREVEIAADLGEVVLTLFWLEDSPSVEGLYAVNVWAVEESEGLVGELAGVEPVADGVGWTVGGGRGGGAR